VSIAHVYLFISFLNLNPLKVRNVNWLQLAIQV